MALLVQGHLFFANTLSGVTVGYSDNSAASEAIPRAQKMHVSS